MVTSEVHDSPMITETGGGATPQLYRQGYFQISGAR